MSCTQQRGRRRRGTAVPLSCLQAPVHKVCSVADCWACTVACRHCCTWRHDGAHAPSPSLPAAAVAAVAPASLLPSAASFPPLVHWLERFPVSVVAALAGGVCRYGCFVAGLTIGMVTAAEEDSHASAAASVALCPLGLRCLLLRRVLSLAGVLVRAVLEVRAVFSREISFLASAAELGAVMWPEVQCFLLAGCLCVVLGACVLGNQGPAVSGVWAALVVAVAALRFLHHLSVHPAVPLLVPDLVPLGSAQLGRSVLARRMKACTATRGPHLAVSGEEKRR